ncbi:MAG: 3-dehydroquinate synthase [Clostridia bacterium]|nr:3-dehydroquinate synthase [Clostridia bacterium]
MPEPVTVRIGKNGGYDVVIGRGLLDGCGFPLPRGARRALLVSDSNVFPLYGKKAERLLRDRGLLVSSFVFPAGESAKNLGTYSDILNAAVSAGLTRADIFAALGGGVTGDLCGFAAATYMRGVGFIQMPTTLLAAVDSSVGGKTGVDLPGGKNLAGAFHRPLAVICDTSTLDTLPDAEYRGGCAEIIKYGMIGSADFLRDLAERPVSDCPEKTIEFCVNMKRLFVEEDEFDRGRRMLLNFGHTFGHAAEQCGGYVMPHGFAVAAGMAAMTRAAAAFGICEKEALDLLLPLLSAYRLPDAFPYSGNAMLGAVMKDKKSGGGVINLIVPERAGSCRILPADLKDVADWMRRGGIVFD